MRLLTCLVTVAMVAFFAPAASACTGTLSVSPAGPGDALPPTGPTPGTSLTVTGTDFVAGPVALTWGSAEGPVIGEAVADEDGGFTVEVAVPRDSGERQRIVAESAKAGSSGMPSTGWVDLVAEPSAAAPAPAPAPEPADSAGSAAQPADAEPGSSGALMTVALMVVLTMAGAGMWIVRRRLRAVPDAGPDSATAVGADVGADWDAELERELAQLSWEAPVPGDVDDRRLQITAGPR